MVARDVKASQVVVEGHRQVAQEPARVIGVAIVPEEPLQVLDHLVVQDGSFVVEDERDMEGIGVGKEADQGDKKEVERRSGREAFCAHWGAFQIGKSPGNLP